MLNSAGWLGIEPPAVTPEPAATPPEPAAAPAAATAVTVILIGPGSSSKPAPLPILPPRLGGVGPIVADVVASLRTGPAASATAAVPLAGTPGETAARAVEARPPASKVPRAGESAPGPGGVAFDLTSSGAAGSVPSGGAGVGFALAGRPFKLVAPAHLGPLTQAPALGRSVDFFDPLERPG